MVGEIFDIRRFAIHDGPGIRTTVFLKGCSLRCIWCHNSEGLKPGPDIWVKKERCIECGTCVKACPEDVIFLNKSGIQLDKSRCKFCNDCIRVCPTGAMQRIDTTISVEELVDILVKDRIFYDESGGGVTLSGGDPLFQPEFSLELLKKLKDAEINTCIETSMFSDNTDFINIIPFVDHFLVDIKLLDDEMHKKHIGASNKTILKNFETLARNANSIKVRIPLIPNITATYENLGKIANYVKGIRPDIEIELLNYNSLAYSKYELMNMKYFDETLREFPDDELDDFRQYIDR